MKFRFSFAVKILLPYLLLTSLFLIIFASEQSAGHPLVIWLSASGIVVSIIVGVVHIFWLRRSILRVRNLLAQLARGNMPPFKASRATDEIGDLERSLEIHVNNLKTVARFTITTVFIRTDYDRIFDDGKIRLRRVVGYPPLIWQVRTW